MSLTILIVEDDRHVRRILESLFVRDPEFAALEPRVLLASDGAEGLQILRAQRPDVVITDLLMPNMDGFQFCRAVRDDPNAGGCTLIVMSAVYKDPGLIAKLRAELGIEFFAKPFQVRDLVRAVRKRLKAAKPGAPPTPIVRARPARVDDTGALPTLAAPMLDEQRGQLGRHPLPRLLLDCHETQATGTLTIRRGNARKEIYLLVGHPIGVESSLRSETLGVYLVQHRILTEVQIRAAISVARERRLKFGQALVVSGLLSEAEVLRHLQAQVRHKIVASLRWPDGTFEFVPGDSFSDRMNKSTVEPVRVVFAGLRRTARVEDIQARLQGSERLTPTPRALRYAEAWRRVFGSALLERLHDQPTVDQLVACLPPVEALPQIDALVLCGLALLETHPKPALAAPGSPSKTPDLYRLGDLERRSSQVVPTVAEGGAPARETSRADVLDELFGVEESRVGLPTGVGPRPPDIDAPDQSESGVIQLEPPRVPSEQTAARPLDPQVAEMRRRISQIYLALHEIDYYELLGVEPNATFDRIAEAFTALAREFKLEQFARYDLGRDYTRVEEFNVVLRKAFETLSDPVKRLEYDRSRAQRRARRDDPYEAELLFRQGEERLAAGDAGGAIPLLERAVAGRPGHAEYHALLGWARLRAGGTGARTQAAADIAHALAMEPELAAGHEYAGRLALAGGDRERALDHLAHALDIEPGREGALALFEEVCAHASDWRQLERQYRKLIHRVGERDPDVALKLWWRLGDCYRNRLGDRASARVAYEVAAKLAPDEPRLQDALVSVTLGDPERWREAARALRTRWRLTPGDAAPLRALYALYERTGRARAAQMATQALVAAGAANTDERARYQRHRTSAAMGLPAPLDRTRWTRLAHPDDDAEIGSLFALLTPVARTIDPFTLADLGVEETDRVTAPPDRFARGLTDLCAVLQVPLPPLYRRADFGAEIHVGATEPPVLFAGAQALEEADPIALIARLARAITYLLPGRATGGTLPSRRLKTFLLAAMSLAAPGVRLQDEDGSIAALRDALAQCPGDTQRRLRELVERITRQKTVVNLSRWARALGRTADRFALVASGDLPAAARVARDAGAQDGAVELIDFALSEAYLELVEAGSS